MNEDLSISMSLRCEGFSNIEIDQIINYLETLDYDLVKTKYIGKISSKNERLAKYFFLRDNFVIEINASQESLYISEILDQCIDWGEFWRLLVIKKGFCCICLSQESGNRKRYVFLAGPNILLGSTSETSNSIHEEYY